MTCQGPHCQDSVAPGKRFCSQQCYEDWRRQWRRKGCQGPGCDKPARSLTALFCSDACAHAAAAARAAEDACPVCGERTVYASAAVLHCANGCLTHGQHGPATRALVTRLWNAGVAWADIKEATGLNSNQLASLRKRLKLTPRTSPIRRGPSVKSAASRNLVTPMRAGPNGAAGGSRAGVLAAPKVRPEMLPGRPSPAPAVPPPPRGVERTPQAPVMRRYSECQYPTDDRVPCPDKPDFGSPYCRAHSELCFQHYHPRVAA